MHWSKFKRIKLIECPFCKTRDVFGITEEKNIHIAKCLNCKKPFYITVTKFAFYCEDIEYSSEPITIRTTIGIE